MTDSLAAPVSANERIEFLDVLRGVALFGILCVNLPLIALPLAEAMGGDNALEAMSSESWTTALVRMLGENKFMALFSTLFGMGLALQVDRAGRAAWRPARSTRAASWCWASACSTPC